MPELLSAYSFTELDRLPLLRERLKVRAGELGLVGTVLVAAEGINFSLGGRGEALDAWVACLAREHGIDRLVTNRDAVESVPFLRLKVRIRPEIITFDPALRPGQAATGQALAPQDWHALLQREDVQLVDTRNHYEYEIGSFKGAVDPDIDAFTDFRDWALNHLEADRPVAMFCTGGVRCEKASAWLLANGYDQVFQLEGGILNYLREIPAQESLWQGECYVFDDRIAVDHDLKPTGRLICAACSRPAEGLGADGMPPIGVQRDCGLCGQHFDAGRLAGLRERVRQIGLARARGQSHIGPQAQPEATQRNQDCSST
ncbi:MAG: hypothetical protein EA370_05725 [Wenzhouxiangella sp.]|nr:MAG: hypothetical protein EA370_05725 [Wenzhouxiangella sp.]